MSGLRFPRWQQVQPPCPGAVPTAPRTEPPAPTWTEGPWGAGGLRSGHVLGLPSKSPAHVTTTIGGGLMKLSTDGYFVVL